MRWFIGEVTFCERKHTEEEQAMSTMGTMWWYQYMNSALLALIVGAKYSKLFSTLDPKTGEIWLVLPLFVGENQDYDRAFYDSTGFYVWIATFVLALNPLLNIFSVFGYCCVRWCDRKCSSNPKRTR